MAARGAVVLQAPMMPDPQVAVAVCATLSLPAPGRAPRNSGASSRDRVLGPTAWPLGPGGLPGSHQRLKFGGRQRLAEVVSLVFVATQPGEIDELLLVFHAFGNR